MSGTRSPGQSLSAIAAYLATATLAAGTITTSQPLTLTQTWNAAGVTFTAFKVNVTDTASAAASLLMDLQVAGSSKFNVSKAGGVAAASFASSATGANATGLNFSVSANVISFFTNNGYQAAIAADAFQVSSSAYIGWSSGSGGGGTATDTFLLRDAANTVALRNSTAYQILNLYSTYTDASNYARASLENGLATFAIKTQKAGTGGDLAIAIQPTGAIYLDASSVNIRSAGFAIRWSFDGSGHFVPGTHDTYDIGLTGTRPRNLFLSGSATISSTIGLGTANSTTWLNIAAGATDKSQLRFIQGVAPTSPVDGDVWREDNTNTGLKVRINGVTKTISVA